MPPVPPKSRLKIVCVSSDVADRAGPDALHQPPVAFAAMSLVAHLRGDLVLLGGLGQLAAFGDVVGQRLLREGGQAALDGPDRRRGMMVVRRGDQHHVEFLVQLVEHLAIVVIDLGFGLVAVAIAVLFQGAGDGVVVDFDDGHEVLAQPGAEGVAAHASHGDRGHAELLVVVRLGQDVGGGKVHRSHGAGRQCSLLDEIAAGGVLAHENCSLGMGGN